MSWSSRPGRTPICDPELLPALVTSPAVLRYPAGKLLAPMLPILVRRMRRDKEADITDEQANLPMAMSAATTESETRGQRAKMPPREGSHTKPGSLPKS